MGVKMSTVWAAVKRVARNLPTIRKELVASISAGLTMVGVFEVTFPNFSIAHLAALASLTAFLTGAMTFLTNNKVVTEIDQFSKQPVWKSRLRYLVKGGRG